MRLNYLASLWLFRVYNTSQKYLEDKMQIELKKVMMLMIKFKMLKLKLIREIVKSEIFVFIFKMQLLAINLLIEKMKLLNWE